MIGGQPKCEPCKGEHDGDREEKLGQIYRIQRVPIEAVLKEEEYFIKLKKKNEEKEEKRRNVILTVVEPIECSVQEALGVRIIRPQMIHHAPELRTRYSSQFRFDCGDRVKLQRIRCAIQNDHYVVENILSRIQIVFDAVADHFFDDVNSETFVLASDKLDLRRNIFKAESNKKKENFHTQQPNANDKVKYFIIVLSDIKVRRGKNVLVLMIALQMTVVAKYSSIFGENGRKA